MERITVFSIVYNGYGKFIPQWNEYMNEQTIPIKKMVILGKDHEADLEYLKDNNIDYIECDSTVMGVLRNKGVERITTDWWFYFAIDDELLPHACEEIVNTDADAVSIRFNAIDVDGKILKDQKSPHFEKIEDLNNWKTMWGGYTAVRGNTDLRYREDIEVPNLSLHFEMFRRGLKVVKSKTILVTHLRWSGSHHFKSIEDGSRTKSVADIEKQKEEVIKEIIERGDNMIIEALMNYKDNELNKEITKGTQYKVSKERGKVILNAKDRKGNLLAKLIEVLENKEEVKEETDLNKLTVAQLKDMAKDKDITGYSTMKKAELISALQ